VSLHEVFTFFQQVRDLSLLVPQIDLIRALVSPVEGKSDQRLQSLVLPVCSGTEPGADCALLDVFVEMPTARTVSVGPASVASCIFYEENRVVATQIIFNNFHVIIIHILTRSCIRVALDFAG